MYELSTFDNGLRLVTVAMPHAYSISTRFYLAVGSRYEPPELSGASHFIEHMLFKGTERRPTPREIAMAVERVGGDLNASTSQEITAYYARVGRDHLPVAADTLIDMLRNSRFLADDVERERQIITEEINESLDIPDELVSMQFQELLWPDHPLGVDIAGTHESVAGLTRDALLEYKARSYSPARTVVAIAGPVTHQSVRDLVEPLLTDWQEDESLALHPAPPFAGPVARALHRPVEQAHFLLGMRGLNRFDEDRFALSLLNIILGEGMSSRLFLQIREEMALAYSIYSFPGLYLDTGSFAVYAALDPENLHDAIEAVQAQLHRLREEPVNEEDLALAKSYSKGRTLLRLEDSGANAGWVGGQLVLGNVILTPDEALERIDRVTVEDIQRLARQLFRDDALALSVVGPVEEDADWLGLLRVE